MEQLKVTTATEHKTRRLYNDLSWLWPMVSTPEEYEEECEFFTGVIKKHATGPVETLLNLGCGGGLGDMTLKKYFKITGVDLSSGMLKQARPLNPEVEYVEGDMRDIRLNKTYDVVTILDSIEYNRSEEDILAAFETAYTHLKPGGMLLTILEYTVENFPQNRTTVDTRPPKDGIQITFIENNYDPDPNDTHFEATFIFMVRKNGKLEIHTDQHLIGLFPAQTWISQLQRAGFQVKQLKFGHSTFEDGQTMPLLLGFKPK